MQPFLKNDYGVKPKTVAKSNSARNEFDFELRRLRILVGVTPKGFVRNIALRLPSRVGP